MPAKGIGTQQYKYTMNKSTKCLHGHYDLKQSSITQYAGSKYVGVISGIRGEGQKKIKIRNYAWIPPNKMELYVKFNEESNGV